MATKAEIESAKKEVAENYQYFKKMQPEWRKGHLSDYALIHHQKLVCFFHNEHDAIQTGMVYHGLGNFSVQAVNPIIIDLGHQSNLLPGPANTR